MTYRIKQRELWIKKISIFDSHTFYNPFLHLLYCIVLNSPSPEIFNKANTIFFPYRFSEVILTRPYTRPQSSLLYTRRNVRSESQTDDTTCLAKSLPGTISVVLNIKV